MFYSDQKKQVSLFNRRTFILFLLKLSLFSAVGWRLYNIQILDSSKYKTMSKKNQIDLEIIFPVRGKIYDRNNVLIAKNEKVYDVYLIPENTKSINNTLNALSQFIDIDFVFSGIKYKSYTFSFLAIKTLFLSNIFPRIGKIISRSIWFFLDIVLYFDESKI